jgi:hypothetical protein
MAYSAWQLRYLSEMVCSGCVQKKWLLSLKRLLGLLRLLHKGRAYLQFVVMFHVS